MRCKPAKFPSIYILYILFFSLIVLFIPWAMLLLSCSSSYLGIVCVSSVFHMKLLNHNANFVWGVVTGACIFNGKSCVVLTAVIQYPQSLIPVSFILLFSLVSKWCHVPFQLRYIFISQPQNRYPLLSKGLPLNRPCIFIYLLYISLSHPSMLAPCSLCPTTGWQLSFLTSIIKKNDSNTLRRFLLNYQLWQFAIYL